MLEFGLLGDRVEVLVCSLPAFIKQFFLAAIVTYGQKCYFDASKIIVRPMIP